MSAWWGLVCVLICGSASLNVIVKLQRAQWSHHYKGYWCIMQSDRLESLCLEAHLYIFSCFYSRYTIMCFLFVHVYCTSLVFIRFCLSLVSPGTACVPPPTCWVTRSGLASWSTFPAESCRVRTLRCATLWSRRTRSPTSLSARKTIHSITATVRPQCEDKRYTLKGFMYQKHFS